MYLCKKVASHREAENVQLTGHNVTEARVVLYAYMLMISYTQNYKKLVLNIDVSTPIVYSPELHNILDGFIVWTCTTVASVCGYLIVNCPSPKATSISISSFPPSIQFSIISNFLSLEQEVIFRYGDVLHCHNCLAANLPSWWSLRFVDLVM